MAYFYLPHHPSLTSIDPLGICDADTEHVSHAAIVARLLEDAEKDFQNLESDDLDHARAWVKRLQRILEDIAYSLHQDGSLNTEGLLEALSPEWTFNGEARRNFLCRLFTSARQLASFFPDGHIPFLSSDRPAFSCVSKAMDALLAHMFLRTLRSPVGNTWGRPGFSQYYDGSILPAVRNTAPAYLRTIMDYFEYGGYRNTISDQDFQFTFELVSSVDMPDIRNSCVPAVQIPTKMVDVPHDPSLRQSAFVLVAANAQPGPGAGGTQEERLIGQSPALATVSLLTPVLQSEEAVVTSAFPVHAAWQGHGRTAKMLRRYDPSDQPNRHYIVADAIPLDFDDGHADLLEGNVEREVRKLYAAFLGGKRVAEKEAGSLLIEMPPWGCGAFGGKLNVKIPCMMMAAGLAGLKSANLELLIPKHAGFDLYHAPGNINTVEQLFASLKACSIQI